MAVINIDTTKLSRMQIHKLNNLLTEFFRKEEREIGLDLKTWSGNGPAYQQMVEWKEAAGEQGKSIQGQFAALPPERR